MDYFSELLESYNKIKKRTFKLTYLEEGEDKEKKEESEPQTDAATLQKAEGLAQGYIAKAPSIDSSLISTKGTKVNNIIGKPTGLIIYKNINNNSVGVMGLGPQGGILSIDKYDTKTKMVNRVPESYDKFVEKLAGESELTKTAQTSLEQDQEQQAEVAQQEEIDLLTRLNTPGSLVMSDPDRFKELAPAIEGLEKKNITQLQKLCEDEILKGDFCEDATQYIGGSNAKSMESKLFNGFGFIGVDKKGRLKIHQVGANVFLETFNTNSELLEALTKGKGAVDCDYVTNRLGLVGDDRVVIFTDPDGVGKESELGDEGVILDKGELHQAMIDKFKDTLPEGCEFKNWEVKASSGALNNIKGTWNENFTGLILRIIATINEGLSLKDETEIINKIGAKFREDMLDKRHDLLSFIGETAMAERGIELQAFPVLEAVTEQIDILEKPGRLTNFIQQILIQLGGLLKKVAADDIIPAGAAQRLGMKVDNFFLFKGTDAVTRAEKAAPALMLNAEDVREKTPYDLYNDTKSKTLKDQIKTTLIRQGFKYDEKTDSFTEKEETVALLSVGNKLSVKNKIKFGDLYLSRACEIIMGSTITGNAPPDDEDAWYSKLDASLGFTDAETGRIPNPVLEQPETIPNPDAPEEFIPNPDYDPTAPATVRGENEGSIATYFSNINKSFDNCRTIGEKKHFTNEEGVIKFSNPKQVAKLIQGIALQSFQYRNKNSAFYNTCTKEVPNDAYREGGDEPKTVRVIRDLESDTPQAKVNRKRASESLQRDLLAWRFRTDYNSDDPVKREGATNALCRMAGATIMEMTEMCQLVTEEKEKGKPLVLNQNDILRGLGAARKRAIDYSRAETDEEKKKMSQEGLGEGLKIEIKGKTVTYKFPVKVDNKYEVITYKTNLERQGDGAAAAPAAAGFIYKTEAAKVGKKVDPLQQGLATKEDTLYQLLRGQMDLLENILNQTKRTQSL